MATNYIEEISYTQGEKIGSGAFGEVYKAFGKDKIYALKNIKCTKDEDLNGGLKEIIALGELSHQNIVVLYNVKATQVKEFEATLSLLLEYCAGGDLNERLSQESTETLKLRWMRQIASAVDYLHNKEIIHRDLKPQNILLTADEDIRIADFGLAKRFAQKSETQTWLEYYVDYGVGASCYIAPDMMNQHYTYKADIFSVGIVFHAIIERKYLFVKGKKCYGVFVNKQPLGIEMYNKKGNIKIAFTKRTVITRLIERTLNYKYDLRPKADEINSVLQNYNPFFPCILL